MTYGARNICLVASTPDGTNSLGIGYVAAALKRAGHHPSVLAFKNHAGLEKIAREVAATDAGLVGISIPSGQAAIDALALVRRTRELGARGHITCGGVFATLCRKRLLDCCGDIDSVIRFDGEIPIVFLADSIARGCSAEGLPGVTTRRGDGLPAPFYDLSSMRLRPDRGPFKLYAGVPSAKISAVRGCWGRCRYCGLAALRSQMAEEARSGGMSEYEIVASGIRGMRRRPVDDVADEMASLYHDHGVRFFHFVDENHLPGDEPEALKAIDLLAEELAARGLGRKAISMMLRADAATRSVVESLAGLGLIRSLLGIESMVDENLRALGRSSSAATNLSAMEAMIAGGITFHFNLLLVHPYSTIEAIRREVRALSDVDGGLLDPFHLEIFEGTGMFRRMTAEGRLRGGPFLWHDALKDERANAFARLFMLIKTQAMGHVPLTSFAYEVLSELSTARHLRMITRGLPDLERTATSLIRKHNTLWRELLENALALACSGDMQEAGDLVTSARIEAARLALEFDVLKSRLQKACKKPLTSETCFPRTAAAATLALAILGGGCYDSSRKPGHDAAEESVEIIQEESEVDEREEACSAVEEHHRISDNASCPSICSAAEDEFFYRFLIDEDGHAVDMETDDGRPIPLEIKACYLDAVRDQVFPCLKENPWWEGCNVLLA
jgi:anaerobic magnesium-protoporphyrin IX monomethyl ester cyclase